MKKVARSCASVALLTLIGLVGCNAGGGSGGGSGDVGTVTLTGIAAAGAPLVGIVHVIGANGVKASSPTGADGSFSVTVDGIASPYLLYAEGIVHQKFVGIYSVALHGGTANVTPLTDYILRLTLEKAPDITNWYLPVIPDSELVSSNLLDKSTNFVMASILPVLDAIGVSSNVNPLTTPFVADGTGMDCVLDVLQIDMTDTTVTVTNRLTGTHFTDDITITSDDSSAKLPYTDLNNMLPGLTDLAVINAGLQVLVDLYQGTPTEAELASFFSNYATGSLFLDQGGTVDELVSLWASGSGGPPPNGLMLILQGTISWDLPPIRIPPGYDRGYVIAMYGIIASDTPLRLETTFACSGVGASSDCRWHGDQKWTTFAVNANSTMDVGLDGTVTFGSNLNVDISDTFFHAYDNGVRSAILKGPGLPSDGVLMIHRHPEPVIDLYDEGDSWYPLTDSDIDSMPENGAYSLYLCTQEADAISGNLNLCDKIETYEDLDLGGATLPKAPYRPTVLDDSLFPLLMDPTSHNLNDLVHLASVSWTNPDDIRVDSAGFYVFTANDDLHFEYVNNDLAPDATTAPIDTTGLNPLSGYYGWIVVTVEDYFSRGFQTFWHSKSP